MKVTAALLASAAALAAAQLAPIPARPDGWKIGSPGAPIVVDAFFDLMCPDSKAANPTMIALREHYGPDKLYFVQHIFPLPYHLTASWVAAEGVEIVNALGGNIFDWMAAMFKHQEDFGYADSLNKTRAQLLAQFGDLAQAELGIPSASFVAAYSNGTLNNAARISWKYGCSRGISGTPIFLVNGVAAPADGYWTLQQWQALLDPLLGDTDFAAKAMDKAAFPQDAVLDAVYGQRRS